jgi:hypothetical protein
MSMGYGAGRRRFRAFALVWGVLQFALPLVVLFTDASWERASARGPGQHIEASGNASCQPTHRDDCALCRFLSNHAAAAPDAQDRLGVESSVAKLGGRPSEVVVAADWSLPGTRAPPIV